MIRNYVKKKNAIENKGTLLFMITERKIRMDKPMLESRLKLYKQHKAEVETTLKRIEVWKEMLAKGELWYFDDSPPGREPGMPPTTTLSSQVEISVISREVTTEIVSQWIKDDESRIFYKKLEVEQLEVAFGALTSEQRFIINAKYCNDMTWKHIEISFNEKFSRKGFYLTEAGLRKINSIALIVLWQILGPLYLKYIYFKHYNLDLNTIREKQSEQRKAKRDRKVAEK